MVKNLAGRKSWNRDNMESRGIMKAGGSTQETALLVAQIRLCGFEHDIMCSCLRLNHQGFSYSVLSTVLFGSFLSSWLRCSVNETQVSVLWLLRFSEDIICPSYSLFKYCANRIKHCKGDLIGVPGWRSWLSV